MRVIKRYANRKLYDTNTRRYINLVEIADLVSGGTEVRVLDSKSNEDITKVTLSQILLETEKKKQGFVPKQMFTNLIRKGGGTLMDYLKRSVKSGLGVITWAEEEIDRGVKKLVRAGEITEQEARRLRDDLVERLMRNKSALEKTLDERITGVLHKLHIPAQRDIRKLSEKLELLARRVESLNGHSPKRKSSETRKAAPAAKRKAKGVKISVATNANAEAAQEKVS